MQNVKVNYNFILLSLSILTIFSYFFGYYIDENSAGGGKGDFGTTWKNLQAFENLSLFEAIKLTASQDSNEFQSSRIPGVYIFHKILQYSFQKSSQMLFPTFCALLSQSKNL